MNLIDIITTAIQTQDEQLNLCGLDLNNVVLPVSELGFAKYMSMGGFNLSSIPESLFKFDQLCELNISNSMVNAIPSAIGNLTNMTSLVLRGNTHLHILPESIGNLSNLRLFVCESCCLTRIPGEILKANSLERASFSKNKIERVPDLAFTQSTMVELNLSFNVLTEVPQIINNYTGLLLLHLGNNKINSVDKRIGELRKLLWLNLDFNGIELLPDELGNCKSLREISLKGNRLRTIPKSIWQLPKISHIDLSGNPMISHEEVDWFKVDSCAARNSINVNVIV